MENLKSRVLEITKNIMFFVALFAGYILMPQVVGLTFYKVFKLSEEVSLVLGNISFVILLISLFYKMFIEKIKDFIKNFGLYFGEGLKVWGIGLLVMYISNLVLYYILFKNIAANEEVNRAFISNHLFIGIISVSIIAPFVEEMIFRFGLKKAFPKTKYFPLISALLFGFLHALTGMGNDLTLMENLMQLLYIIPYGALGYSFGYIYDKTDNIFVSMLIHALHNTIGLIAIIGVL